MFTVLFNIFEQQWFQVILGAFAVGLSGLITYAFALLQAWLKTKVKNEKMGAILDAIMNIIKSAVLSIQQTFVDSLKKEGKFDKEKQAQALEMVLTKVKAELTAEAQEALKLITTDVDAWIRDQVEAIIYTNK